MTGAEPPAAAQIAIVSAGTGGALDPLIAAARGLAATAVWAPLAAPDWLARAPGPLGAFGRRRVRDRDRAAPSLLLVEGVLRAWAGARTDRRYRAELALRTAIDRWAAREVRRARPRVVIAPSLAARHSFAAAREVGAATVLVLDLPLLRALHRDLDRAAAAWPDRRFLRRYRAPSWAIARQEAERVMADLVLVRGPYARACCAADGISAARLGDLPAPPPRELARPAAPTGRLRLAGLAAARHGVDTAIAAARALGLELVVRVGEGTEPAGLAEQPGISTLDGPVDAVICPAICEAYPAEVQVRGLPVIASPMASLEGDGPDPFDPEAFAAAIREALTAPEATPAPAPPAPAPSILPQLAALL
ncbi:MAG: hypothetical protein ACTHU0_38240 [Kofleriaceae bacterium]